MNFLNYAKKYSKQSRFSRLLNKEYKLRGIYEVDKDLLEISKLYRVVIFEKRDMVRLIKEDRFKYFKKDTELYTISSKE